MNTTNVKITDGIINFGWPVLRAKKIIRTRSDASEISKSIREIPSSFLVLEKNKESKVAPIIK